MWDKTLQFEVEDAFSVLKIGVISEKINSPQVPPVKGPPRRVVAPSVDPWPGLPAPLVPPPDIRAAEGPMDPPKGQEAPVGGLPNS